MSVKTTQVKNRLENGHAAAPPVAAAPAEVLIPKIEPQRIELIIVGTTPLVVNAWSHKAKKQMLDKQMKKATRGKEAKDPEADYKASRYISAEGWDGIPAGGVKGCLVNACRAVDGLPMTLAKRMLFVASQGTTAGGQGLVRIYGKPQVLKSQVVLPDAVSEMHEGMVRLDAGGTADIRFRAMYREWSMRLEIDFLASVISAEQVANLVELAGFIEGLCEHRPGAPKSNTGDWGRFQIKRDE
jgi:hypothetical protein